VLAAEEVPLPAVDHALGPGDELPRLGPWRGEEASGQHRVIPPAFHSSRSVFLASEPLLQARLASQGERRHLEAQGLTEPCERAGAQVLGGAALQAGDGDATDLAPLREAGLGETVLSSGRSNLLGEDCSGHI